MKSIMFFLICFLTFRCTVPKQSSCLQSGIENNIIEDEWISSLLLALEAEKVKLYSKEFSDSDFITINQLIQKRKSYYIKDFLKSDAFKKAVKGEVFDSLYLLEVQTSGEVNTTDFFLSIFSQKNRAIHFISNPIRPKVYINNVASLNSINNFFNNIRTVSDTGQAIYSEYFVLTKLYTQHDCKINYTNKIVLKPTIAQVYELEGLFYE